MNRTFFRRIIALLISVIAIFETTSFIVDGNRFSLLSQLGIYAEAADSGYGKVLASGKHGTNVTYVYYEDGTLVVSGTGSMINDKISTAGQYNTNRRRWSGYEHQIKRAIINEGVTTIGDFAFYYCENLESISMPSTITYIGIDAFHFCSKIKNIVIPSSVNTIRRYAFGRTNISSIIIPASVNTLESHTFYYNKSLNTVIFEKGSQLKSIGYYCFGDTSLSRIMLPSTLTSISDYAFYACNNLSGIYYQGSQEQWKSISKGGSNDGLSNSKIYYHCSFYGEEFGTISNTQEQNEITINVKAVDEKTGELVSVDGATVEIKLDGKTIISKKSNNGVATFTRNEISKTGHDISNVIKSASVVASKSIGNEMYVTNLEDSLSNKSNVDITLDNLQFRPTISVGYNNGVVTYNEVKRTLDAYVNGLYYLTRGSILVSISSISAYTSDHLLFFSNRDLLIGNKFKTNAHTNGYGKNAKFIRVGIKDTGLTPNILCHESLHYFIGARDEYCCASKYNDNDKMYALDFNGNGKIEDYIYYIYWAENENYVLPKSYKFESNEYLSLKWEQYRSELLKNNINIGDISNRNGELYWINYKNYTNDYFVMDESDEIIYSRKSVIGNIEESKATYWGTVYPRPSNFGIMDKGYALYLSSYSSYSYLNGIENKTVHSYTPQWYYNYKPVENQLEDFIKSKATSNKYEASVLLGAMDLSHTELQLDTDYVHEEIEEEITSDENSALLHSAICSTSHICFTSFDKSATGTTINLSSADLTNLILLVKYSNNPTYERFDAVFENGSATIGISDANGTIEYVYAILENEDGTYTYNQFIYETFGEAVSDGSYNSTVMTVSTANDNSENLAVYSDESSYEEGEFFSVADSFYAVELTDAEIEDTFTQTVSYNAEIDFTSITAFMFDGEVYTPLETYVGGGENNCAYVSFPYSGEGKYILMAKSPAETVYEAPTNLLVDDINSTHEKEIHVSFEDTNDIYNVATYNIYYSKSEITDTNAEGVTCVSVKPGNDSYTLYLNDEYGSYYFYVEVIGKDGGKSPLSEPDYFSLAPYDDDADGIPDYWLNWYPSLAELEDIPGTDSDEDGLTNLQEYQNGTNPLNPDTDGDNVYDSVELWNDLNPLEPMTDGVTDDYIVVYGAPDVAVDTSSFIVDESTATCTLTNSTDGKAMRTLIYLYVGDELIEVSTVNLDANSSVDYTFSREYLVEGMRIVLDEGRITRDIDYSNNEFVCILPTGISVNDSQVTVAKGTETNIEYSLIPENATDVLEWKSADESIASVNGRGVVTGKKIGKTNVTATTPTGYIHTYNVLVESFPGAGENDFDCRLINNNTELEIIGYYGDETNLIIPDSIGGYPITSVADNSFSGCNFETVKINSEITDIGQSVFNGLTSLKSIDVDENNIVFCSDNGMLYNADKSTLIRCPLANENKAVVIPDTVTTIDVNAFNGATGLASVCIPESVTSIKSKSFSGINLTEINYAGSGRIWNNITKASDSGLSGKTIVFGKFTATFICEGETINQSDYMPGETILLPDNITEKKYYTFTGWTPAVPETMPEHNISFTAVYEVSEATRMVEFYVDGALYWYDYRYEGETINIPETVPTKVGYTFAQWSPEVQETMTSEDMVYEAEWTLNVHKVTFKAEGKTYYSYDCAYGEPIIIPEDPSKDYFTFIGWDTEIPETMPDNDLTITAVIELVPFVPHPDFECEFISGSNNLKIVSYLGSDVNVVIPDTISSYPVTEINVSAFENVELESICLGKNISSVLLYSFLNASYTSFLGNQPRLKSIGVAEGSEYFVSEDGVLYNVSKTKIVRYPAAKEGNEFYLPETVEEISGCAFEDVQLLETLHAPASLKIIKKYAFRRTNLKTFCYPKGLGTWNDMVTNEADSGLSLDLVKFAEFTATFVADGIKLSQTDYDPGEEIIIPESVPEVEYCYFAGWAPEVPEGMPSENCYFYAVYKPITYTATFMNGDEVIGTDEFTMFDHTLDYPGIETRLYYRWIWDEHKLKPENMIVSGTYVPISYTVAFVVDGETISVQQDTKENSNIVYPEIPERKGYTAKWIPETYTPGISDCTITAVYTPIRYTATFVCEGKTVGTDTFTIEDAALDYPYVPYKAHYNWVWDEHKIDTNNMTVTGKYVPVIYTIRFVSNGVVKKIQEYTIETIDSIVPPKLSLPAKPNHTTQWEKWQGRIGNITVNEIYVPIRYELLFYFDDVLVKQLWYRDENIISDISIPAAPVKKGYNVSWPEFNLEYRNQRIDAICTPVEYTAKFIADGEVISTQIFTVETQKLIEPPIPPKAGYIGTWRYYKIDAKDMTITAKYSSPEVTATSKVTLDIGESFLLLPSCNFEITHKTWTSSDTSVAKVNSNGKVTAVGEGKCKITITCHGKDSLGNDIHAKKTTKIVVNKQTETEGLKQSFREEFNKFFEVKLHDFVINLKEIFRSLIPYII